MLKQIETASTRRHFIAGVFGVAAAGGLHAERNMQDWKPSVMWHGFNLLGMFRCPTTGLAPDPRVDGHFAEWEFKALHDWGFNFARLPLDYRILVKDDSWTSLDENKMNWMGTDPTERAFLRDFPRFQPFE